MQRSDAAWPRELGDEEVAARVAELTEEMQAVLGEAFELLGWPRWPDEGEPLPALRVRFDENARRLRRLELLLAELDVLP